MRFSIESITAVSGSPNRFRITTREPHFRTMNNKVRILQLRLPGGLVDSTSFNGYFAVAAYDPANPQQFDYDVPAPRDVNVNDLFVDYAFVGIGHIALSADGGTGNVVERNRVYHCVTGGPYHDTWSSKDLMVRHNYYHGVRGGPYQNFGNVSFNPVPIPLVSLDYDDGTELCSTLALHAFDIYENTTAVAKTSFPHGIPVGDFVIISSGGVDAALYNGRWQIIAVPLSDVFEYAMSKRASVKATGAGFGTSQTIPPPIDVILPSQRRLESLTRIPNTLKAQAKTTYDKHGFSVGDAVRISYAGNFGQPNSPYNGNFVITAIQDPKTFEYEISSDPGTPDHFSSGYFGRIWQLGRLVIENNVIEVGFQPLGGYGQAWALAFYSPAYAAFAPQYPISQGVVRGNIIRFVNDASDTTSAGILLLGTKEAVVAFNVVATGIGNPLSNNPNTTVRTFNNLTPDGVLLESSIGTSQKAPEVTKLVRVELEDAIISHFLDL